MKFEAKCAIRNTFTVHVDNVRTGEHREYKAHNIVLNQMWDRLTSFSTYFAYIAFGQGTGTFNDPARTQLYDHIDLMAATDEYKKAAYPTSQWRRKIVINPGVQTGKTITELGICHGNNRAYLATHAPILDSEGNQIALGPKGEYDLYTIFADVFISLWGDYGAFFYANGLRNYLLDTASMATDQIAVSFIGQDPVNNTYNFDMWQNASTRTRNASERWVQGKVRFEADQYNKDIRYLDWMNMGMRIELPRPGVWTGKQRDGVVLGAGDDSKKIFVVPNRGVTGIVVYIDNTVVPPANYTFNGISIAFDTAPGDGLSVTADYLCPFIPKDSDHILDITFRLTYGIEEPAPGAVKPSYSGLPAGTLEPPNHKGTETLGFFGEVATANLISGEDLCDAIGLTAGTLQYSTEPWLKFVRRDRMLFVAKKPYRYNISWNDINAAGAVYGDAVIIISGIRYAVRLLSDAEWNALIYPVHVDYGQWAQYSNADIVVASGNGSTTWTSTASGSNRVYRGSISVANSGNITPSIVGTYCGFRPALEPLLPATL